MKKFILFLLLIVVVFGLSFWFAGGKKIISSLDDNKTYEFIEQKTNDISMLDMCKFLSNGIVTYNNQKITYVDYDNNVVWNNENRVFTDSVFVSENYIYKCLENSIEILDSNNQSYVVTGIQGKIANVSRENNKTYIISKINSMKNSLYILNENNEVVLENKEYSDSITGVTIGGKSESYCVNTVKYSEGKISNKISYNLIDSMELWNKTIDDEVIIKIKIVNNDVLVIGTENIYYFNSSGSLIWKNSNYNKIKDILINEKNERIYVLYEQGEKVELLGYNFEGKVKEIYKLSSSIEKFKVFNNKIYVYDDNSISLLHDNITDKLFEKSNYQIIDFNVVNSNIFILLKDKLITGTIK